MYLLLISLVYFLLLYRLFLMLYQLYRWMSETQYKSYPNYFSFGPQAGQKLPHTGERIRRHRHAKEVNNLDIKYCNGAFFP